MKIKSVMAYVYFTFIVPIAVRAQEAGNAAAGTQSSSSSISQLLNKVIAQVSQIGNIFGDATGFRIGGTTGTAIAALVIAKLVEDKVPSWIKWVLYLTGGTMFAGGGANIAQFVMQYIGK